MVTLLSHRKRNIQVPTLSEMDRWMSLQQGVSHSSLEWTDGNDWAGSFPYFGIKKRKEASMVLPYCGRFPYSLSLSPQNGQMDVPPAGSFPYFNGMD